MSSKLFVGTSGYNYRHWGNNVFYPVGLPQRRWLEHYAKSFSSVELNVSFYRLPKKSTFESWYDRTPMDFVFAVKGSRFITHLKKLVHCEEPLCYFFDNASGLKEKLGIVLWQFPPGFHVNEGKLTHFCELLSSNKVAGKTRHAFEFRHHSWFCQTVYDLLSDFNYSLCIAHSTRWPYEEVLTADYVYLRFHGGQTAYGSDYAEEELKRWAAKAKSWLSSRKDVYAFFNNDAHGYAVCDALKLRQLLA